MTQSDLADVKVNQPTANNILWTSAAWANGVPRTLHPSNRPDPYDPKLYIHGSSPVSIDGNGVLQAKGPTQRIYIMQPHENIRLTCQVRTLSIDSDPDHDDSRGHVFEVRTSHHHPRGTDPDGAAYAYYFRYDKPGEQGASFKKELTHPYYTGETARSSISFNPPDWVSVTIECRNTANGVLLTSYLNGSKVTKYEDIGDWVTRNSHRREIIKNGEPYPGPGQLYPAIILRDTYTTKEYKDVVIEAL